MKQPITNDSPGRGLGYSARGLSVLALAALATLLVFGCGGGSNGDEAVSATATPAAALAFSSLDLERFTSCVRAGGFQISDGATPAELIQGDIDPALRDQLTFCARQQGANLPEGGMGDPGALLACLRDAGIQVESPNSEPALPGMLGSLDRTDPEVQAALQTCTFENRPIAP